MRFRKELMKESHTEGKGDIGLDWEGLARGGNSLLMKWYRLNIYFTYAQSAQFQVQLVLIVFQRFSLDR